MARPNSATATKAAKAAKVTPAPAPADEAPEAPVVEEPTVEAPEAPATGEPTGDTPEAPADEGEPTPTGEPTGDTAPDKAPADEAPGDGGAFEEEPTGDTAPDKAPEAPAEDKAPTGPTPEQVFENVVREAKDRYTGTGPIPGSVTPTSTGDAGSIADAYLAIGKGRDKVSAALVSTLSAEAMDTGNGADAFFVMHLGTVLKQASTRPAVPAVDHEALLGSRYTALTVAAAQAVEAALAHGVDPRAIPEALAVLAGGTAAPLVADRDLGPVWKAAYGGTAPDAGRIPGGRTGRKAKGSGGGSTATGDRAPKGSVDAHIVDALTVAGKALTVAEIVAHAGPYYPAGQVSQGAVSAKDTEGKVRTVPEGQPHAGTAYRPTTVTRGGAEVRGFETV